MHCEHEMKVHRKMELSYKEMVVTVELGIPMRRDCMKNIQLEIQRDTIRNLCLALETTIS